MATSADALIGSLLQQPGLIGQAFQQARTAAGQQAQNAVDVQLGQQQIQANQQAFAAQAQAQQQQQQFGQWWQDYASNPTPDKLRQGIALFPQQAKAIQDQSAALDAPARQSRELQLGQLYNAAKNGRADLVGSQLDDVIAAEQKAGIDTKDAEQVKAALASGDKDALKGVVAFTQAHLALSNPDFAKTLGIGDRENHYTQLGSGGLYDQRTGEIIRQPDDPGDKPQFEKVKNADGSESIVQLGGGGQASTAGGAAGGSGSPARTVGGWTPRKSAGGDNPDNVVDNKISGMAASLGIAPTAAFPAGMSNRQVFDALTLSEGGKGSLADRNNNPGNLTDPKTGAYRKFPTKEAGIAAGVAQVARNRARGANTIQTMVEGRPVGGAPTSNGVGKVVYTSQGAAPGTSDNAKLDQPTIATMAQQYLAGDPSVLTNLGRGKQGSANVVAVRAEIAKQARAAGLTGAQIAAQMVQYKGDAAAMRTAGVRSANSDLAVTEFQNLVPLALKASDAVPRSSFLPFSKAQAVYRNNTNDPKYKQFVAATQGVINTYARAISPTGTPTVSDKDHARDVIDTATSPEAYRAVVAQLMQEAHAAKAAPGQVRHDIYNAVGGRNGGAQTPHFTHMSASGKFGWNGSAWVPVQR